MQEEFKNQEHIIGSAVMDTNYNFTLADEEIYTFLGDKVVSLFTAYIHPDDREKFIETVKGCDSAGDRFVTVRLKNFTGKYWLAIIFIRPSAIDPDKFFELDIYDIVYLVQEYNSLSTKFKKCTYTMQLMKPAVAFDYDSKTGKITVYTDRDEMRYNGDIDQLYKYIVEHEMIDRMQISGLHKLCDDIKRGTAGVSCDFNMKLSTSASKLEPVSIRTAVMYDKDSSAPTYVIGVASNDADGSYSAEKLYSNRSNLDPLTGLYNKAAIKEMATDALINADQVITYVMLDLDHFKEVNDTYGHMFGDEVILNAARIIKDIVGKKGFVGRVGGDEFFIVLKGIGSELDDLRPILRAIRAQIEWAYKGKLGSIKLTTSIGCASYPKDADNYDDLFKLADRCLYIAKAKGRNRFIIYTKEIHGSLDEIKAIDNSIKMERTISDMQRLEFVTDAICRLNDWKHNAIASVLKEIPTYFRVDEVIVYDLADGKAVFASDNAERSGDNICDYYDSFKANFRESNVFYYGDNINLKIPYPEFYEYTQKNQYLSLFVYAIRNNGEITHLAVVYTKGRYEKWSDMVINLFSIIFKTVGDKIING